MRYRSLLLFRLLGLGLLLPLALAHAEVLATRQRWDPVQAGFGGPVASPCAAIHRLDTVPFLTTRDQQRIVIVFSGECVVQSSNPYRAVTIDFTLDTPEGQPLGWSDDRFCAARGTPFLPGPHAGRGAASRQLVMVIPRAGLHTLRVYAHFNTVCDDLQDDQWWIDNYVTTIMR